MVKLLSCCQSLLPVTRWALLFALTALLGCGRGQVQEYRVAKEQTQPPMPSSALPPGHPDTSAAAAPALDYKRPEGWQEVAPGQIRVASFRVAGKDGKQADVSVVPLPGMAGSDLDNLNRWRGQVGLPGVSEAESATLAQPVEISGQPAKLYEQAGSNPGSGEKARILAAIIRRDGVAWFFKMTGEDSLVAEQKPIFIAFLKSVTFPPAGVEPQLPSSHPPIAGAGMTIPTAAAAPSGQPKPNWEVPSGWKEVPGGQFLVAKFALAGDANAQASVNVSMSSGDGGGLFANVNRWRNQLGLGPETEAGLPKVIQPLDVPGGKATLVDITGQDARTGQKARLLAIVVPQSGDTWFYKLMGDTQIVEREKDTFIKFVQTVKY